MRLTERIAINTLAKWAEGLISAGLAFFILPFLVVSLGKEGFGVTSLVRVVVEFALVAQLGLRYALGRHLAERIAKQDEAGTNQLFSSAVMVYGLLSIALCAIFALAAPHIVDFLRIAPEWRDDARTLFRWFAGPFAAVTLIEPAFGAVLLAKVRFDLLAFVKIAEVTLRSAMIFAVLSLSEAGVYGWAGAMFAGSALALALAAGAAYWCYPALRCRPSLVRRGALVELYSLGGFIFLRESTAIIGQRTDPLVISRVLGQTAVTIYAPGLQLANAVAPFLFAFMSQLSPVTTTMHALGKTDQLHQVLIRATRIGFLNGLACTIGMTMFARPIMEVWLGGKLAPDEIAVAATVLALWALVHLWTYASGVQWPLLLGMNRVRFATLLGFSLALVNLLASIALVAWMHRSGYGQMSLVGAILPTIVCNFLEKSIVMVHCAQQVEMPLGRLLKEAYLRPLVVGLLLAPASWIVLKTIDPHSWPTLGLCAVLLAGLWLALSWRIALDDADRGRFRQLVGRLRRSPAPTVST